MYSLLGVPTGSPLTTYLGSIDVSAVRSACLASSARVSIAYSRCARLNAFHSGQRHARQRPLLSTFCGVRVWPRLQCVARGRPRRRFTACCAPAAGMGRAPVVDDCDGSGARAWGNAFLLANGARALQMQATSLNREAVSEPARKRLTASLG